MSSTTRDSRYPRGAMAVLPAIVLIVGRAVLTMMPINQQIDYNLRRFNIHSGFPVKGAKMGGRAYGYLTAWRREGQKGVACFVTIGRQSTRKKTSMSRCRGPIFRLSELPTAQLEHRSNSITT